MGIFWKERRKIHSLSKEQEEAMQPDSQKVIKSMCIDNGNIKKSAYSKEQKSVIIIGQTAGQQEENRRVRSFPKSTECEPERLFQGETVVRSETAAKESERKSAIVPALFGCLLPFVSFFGIWALIDNVYAKITTSPPDDLRIAANARTNAEFLAECWKLSRSRSIPGLATLHIICVLRKAKKIIANLFSLWLAAAAK